MPKIKLITKGTYSLTYTIDKHILTLLVEVNLESNTFPLKPYENIYKGVAYVNGSYYDKIDISHSINAKLSAEKIGLLIKEEIKKDSRINGKNFSVKTELIK